MAGVDELSLLNMIPLKENLFFVRFPGVYLVVDLPIVPYNFAMQKSTKSRSKMTSFMGSIWDTPCPFLGEKPWPTSRMCVQIPIGVPKDKVPWLESFGGWDLFEFIPWK